MTTQPNEEDDVFALQSLPMFMDKYNIVMARAEQISKRPDHLMDDMPPGSTHWKVAFERWIGESKRSTISTYFSQGPAHKTSPTAEDVFSCLISDAEAGQYDPFEFMLEFGYTNPRQARRAWQACVLARQQMIEFLGEDLLEEALYETEAY